MNDERFTVSADMRLVELHRQALGIAPPASAWRRSDDSELPETPVPGDSPPRAGTVLVVTADARPRRGLIPGAIVTASISVLNDGAAAARNVSLTLPLPAETALRPGTLAVDGGERDDAAAAALFAEGLDLGSIEPGERRTVDVGLAVEPGVSDITLAPHVTSGNGAVVGPGAVRVVRGRAPAAARAPERPFYELDADDEAYEAAYEEPARDDAAASDEPATAPAEVRVEVVQPAELPPPAPPRAEVMPELEPLYEPEAEPEPEFEPEPEPDVPVQEPEPIPEFEPEPKPEPEPEPAPAAPAQPASAPAVSVRGAGGPVLTVTLDQKRLGSLRSLFGSRSLGMIAHYLVLNALAATDPLPGDGDAAELRRFVTAQEQLLSRALIATRLGKTPAPETIEAPLPPFPPAVAARDASTALEAAAPPELRLVRAFKANEIAFLQRVLGNADAPPFLRVGQLFVGMAANDVALADASQRRRMATALSEYTSLAAAEINRIFLRAKLTRTAAPFKETEAAFDTAARSMLDTLAEAFA